MKFPFVKRSTYEALRARYENEKGRTIAYIPAEYPNKPDGTPMQIPGYDYCFHDRRIGWVRRREFKDYAAYIDYRKEAYLAGEEV